MIETCHIGELVEIATNAMVVIDQNGTIEMVNRKAESLFGYPRTELLGRLIEVLLPERFREQHPGHRAHFFADPSPRPMGSGRDLLGRKRDGSEFYVEIGLNPIQTIDGYKVLSEFVDISYRKRVEAQLIQTNERFSFAADAAGIGFWDFDIESNTIQWDDWMFRLYGRSPVEGDQPYSLWADSLHPEDRDRSEREVREAIEGIRDFDTEFRIVLPNGEIRTMKATACGKRDTDGRLVRMFGVNFDLTQRKQVEQTLRESEERFRTILDNIRDYAIVMLDAYGHVISWNPGAERIKGFSLNEIVGKHFSLFYSNEDIEDGKPGRDLANAAAHGRFEDEGWRVRKGGTRYPANVIITAIRDEVGGLGGFIKVSRDVTESRRAEKRLRQVIKELNRSNDELNNFAYIASHDLKSPLRGIDQLATWIEEDLGDMVNADVQGHLRLMRNRISRMEMLLDDLLAYSRIGRSNEDAVRVNTNELVHDVFDLSAGTRQIALQVSPELPVLHTYKTPLEMVFRNLIGNAVKHHDKPQGLIAVDAKSVGTAIEFSVRDDGPGIAAEHQKRVFEMFQTLKPRDEIEGSGIGLALVKKAVESVGGTITLESDGHSGSTFRFTWPIQIEKGEY